MKELRNLELDVRRESLLSELEMLSILGGSNDISIDNGTCENNVTCEKFVVCMFLPYPDVLTGKLVIYPSQGETGVRGVIYLPAVNIGSVVPGTLVRAETENYPSSHYGILQGKVESVCGTPEQNDLYCVYVSLSPRLVTDKGYLLSDTMMLVGTGKIVLNDRRLSEVIMDPLFKWVR